MFKKKNLEKIAVSLFRCFGVSLFSNVLKEGVFKTRNGEMAKWRNDEMAKWNLRQEPQL